MATDLRQHKPAGNKYDVAVAAQLARAEGRIRALDLALGGLGLLAGLLAYALGMVVADHLFDLSAFTRRAFLLLGAAGALAYLWYVLLRPLRRRINPYYAARQVENVLPGAKNSVVNWVDLHDEPLPPAIHGALGRKAAKDVRRADLEQAISGRHVGWTALIVAALGIACVVAFLVLGPRPFFHRIARAFGPFGAGGGLPTRTQLTILRPEGGDATVTVGQPLRIVVRVAGTIPRPDDPDALRLLYRYQQSEPYLERPLRPEMGQDWEWGVTVRALDVRNGFWYRVAGGDAETPEYRVAVRSTPQITDFQATYHYRPYVAHIDEIRYDRDLKALRGTKVVLRARTNRALTSARMDFAGTRRALEIPATLVPGEKETFEVRFVLEEAGKYRLSFISEDGEPYTDLKYYPVEVLDDLAPKVELTEPGKDIQLPADGLLQLAGQATDDLGVKEVTLRARVTGGPELQPRPYRPGELQLEGGGYPVVLAYKDFLDLAQVKDAGGKPLTLKAGMELEYWLEAVDACDYPGPHKGESKHFRVKLTEPQKDQKKRQEQRDRAERERKEHQQKQDEKLKQEAEARKRKQQEQQARQEEEARKREQERREREGSEKKDGEGDKGEKGEKSEKGDSGDEGDTGEKGDKGDKGAGKKPESEAGDTKSKEGGEKPGDESAQAKKDRELADKARKLDKLIDKKEKEQKEKGEGKGAGESDPGQAKGDGKDSKGEEKSAGEGKGGESPPMGGAGEGKDRGKSEEGMPPGEGKDSGKGGMKDKGTPKGGNPDADPGAGAAEAKGREKGAGSVSDGQARAEGKKGPGKDGEARAGTDKSAGSRSESGDARRAEGKPAGSEGERTADGKPQGEPKGRPEAPEKGTGKAGGSDARAGKDSRGTPKGDPGAPMGDRTAKGQDKPGGKDPGEDRVARGEAKPDAKSNGSGPEKPDPRAQKATPEDVEKLAQKAKSADGPQRDEAREDLEKIERQAQDPRARAAAGRELDEMRREELKDQVAKAKPLDPNSKEGQPNPSGEPCAKCKGGGMAGGSGTGQGKSAGKKGSGEEVSAKGEGKGKGKGAGEEPGATGPGKGMTQGGNPGGKPGEKGAEGETATALAKGLRGKGGGDNPGLGLSGDRTAGGSDNGPARDLPENPFPPGEHRATQLQLERFRDKVDKDILKGAHMSPEEFRAFLDSLKKRAQKQEAEARSAEDLPGPKFGGSLPSGRGRTRTPGSPAAEEVLGSGRAAPPPGYRNAYREFLRKVAEKEGKE